MHRRLSRGFGWELFIGNHVICVAAVCDRRKSSAVSKMATVTERPLQTARFYCRNPGQIGR